MQNTKPKALFITPIFPGGYNNGLSMRAALWLLTLSRKYEVYLLVVPISDGKTSKCNKNLSNLCSKIIISKLPFALRVNRLLKSFLKLPLGIEEKYLNEEYAFKIINREGNLKEIAFEKVHILRSYLSEFAKPFINGTDNSKISISLDFDDIESITSKRLSDLKRLHNQHFQAQNYLKRSQYFEKVEKRCQRYFDRFFVASEIDLINLERSGARNISVLPNTIITDLAGINRHFNLSQRDKTFLNFIFVGNFQYFPNQDAILWLTEEILPNLRRLIKERFTINLIGSGCLPIENKLRKIPEIQVINNPENLDCYYQNADIAIVPLRAGGGTRIKIIEAFYYKVPVVCTTIGCEGLNIKNEVHALIADDAEKIAECCFKIVNSKDLIRDLTENAHNLFLNIYSPQRVAEELSKKI